MKHLMSSHLLNGESRHQCMIYDGDPVNQLPVFAGILKDKLNEGFRCMYLNRPSMLEKITPALASIGIDVDKEISSGRLILTSDTPATDEDFDIDGMLANLEEALDQALRDGLKGLFATGDMTWEFKTERNFTKLMEYEYRLEKFFQRRPEFTGICQYHKDTMTAEACRQGVLHHQAFFLSETVSRFNPHFIPTGWVTDQGASNAKLDMLISQLCEGQRVLEKD